MPEPHVVPAHELARQINAATQGARIAHLESRELDSHFNKIYVLKLGLKNSFGIDLRCLTHPQQDTGKFGARRSVLLSYLSEIVPLLEPQANRLPNRRRKAYEKIVATAVDSFWEIYYRFQPMIQRTSETTGVEIDQLGNVLGRAILLYDKTRGFKFYSYFEKTLRESAKNLRGIAYADQYRVPVSAGRLLPQLFWLLDQETLSQRRRLTSQECDSLLTDYLQNHRAKFSASTIQTIVRAVQSRLPTVQIDSANLGSIKASALPSELLHANDRCEDPVELREEYELLLDQIHRAIEKAQFTPQERAIVLQKLELAFDENLYSKIEGQISEGSMRNRRSKLLVRFFAAMNSDRADRFGRFLLAEPVASRAIMNSALRNLADQLGTTIDFVIDGLLNHMSLTDGVYRLSITERARLDRFLREHPMAKNAKITGHLYNKFKAALIDQDRQAFPCLRHAITD